MSFSTLYDSFPWAEERDAIYEKTRADVERALVHRGKSDAEDFKALVSPAADGYLEDMARISRELTEKRFGKTIQLYIPLYLSNECLNICTYCGFSLHNKLPRITLTDAQILRETDVIKAMGYDHVLLVSGEAGKTVGVDYFSNAIRLIRPHFAHISLEVQPLEEGDYRRLAALGLHTVLVYQETYDRPCYAQHHPKGRKSNFYHRLDTPDRLGRAGIRKIGLGALIGLSDWRADSFFTALHLSYLEKIFWQTKYSISFPRLRPAEGYPAPAVNMTDRELVQLICAWRIFNEDVELSISTRERPRLRDHLVGLGITAMSAGSRTNPGGYSAPEAALEQFAIDDARSPQEIAAMIRSRGYEPVWKDWDEVMA